MENYKQESKKIQEEIEIFDLNLPQDILVYSDSIGSKDKFSTYSVYSTFECGDDTQIKLNFNGVTLLEKQSESITSPNSYAFGNFNIQNQFQRFPGKLNKNESRNNYYEVIHSPENKEQGILAVKSFVHTALADLLFDSDNSPTNNYLQTCKNPEGKTIFNTFKQEN